MTPRTELLHHHPDLQPTVCRWLADEWPGYYGPGGVGCVATDVQGYARHTDQAPLGRVAWVGAEPCGFAALKAEPFATHRDRGPWLGALRVVPTWRRCGVGAALVRALEADARRLGHPALYAATATADRLFLRLGWTLLADTEHGGAPIRIYCITWTP